MEEIERAYSRPLPGPSESLWVRFSYWNQRRIRRNLKVFMGLWFTVLGVLTGSAAIDVFGHMGWGYHLKDVQIGLLMMVLGIPAWAFFAVVQDIVGAWTRRFYGPDPSEPRWDDNAS